MKKYNILLFFILFSIVVRSQTAGSGSASSIIYKVNQILDLQKQNDELDRKRQKELDDLNDKLRSLKNKISDLEREWIKVLKELNEGYYCSQCTSSRTEIEAPGKETFAQHLNRVSGVRMPASKEMIEDRRKKYDIKIAEAQEAYDQLNQTGGNYRLNMDRFENQKKLNLDRIEELKEQIKLDQRKWNESVYQDLIRQYLSLYEPIVREIWKKRRVEIAIEKMDKIISKMESERDSVVRARINEYRERNGQEQRKKESERFNFQVDLNNTTNAWNAEKYRLQGVLGDIYNELNKLYRKLDGETDIEKSNKIWARIYELQKDSFRNETDFKDKKDKFETQEKNLKTKIQKLEKEIEEIRMRMFDESKLSTLVNNIYNRKLNFLREFKNDLNDQITQLEQNIRNVEGDAQLKRRMILARHETEVYELYTYLNKIGMSMYQEGITNANYKWSAFSDCCGYLKRGQAFIYECDQIGALWAQLGSPDGAISSLNVTSPVSQTDLDLLIGQIKK